MTDQECIRFLQWALPKLRYRWAGFRKVRKQVCKRLSRRLKELGIAELAAYRTHLDTHSDEWRVLDAMCRVTISRFYRDRRVWDTLRAVALPAIIHEAEVAGAEEIRCWSAGCGSGEEAYTLRIVWDLGLPPDAEPGLSLKVTATDSNPALLARAQTGLYTRGSLKMLPPEWIDSAFESSQNGFAIRAHYKRDVQFVEQDIRYKMPDGVFHLVLCRNLVFTYYEGLLQTELARRIADKLVPGGFLVVGAHESLPVEIAGLQPLENVQGIYSNRSSP